jgi:all-trans-8'-apo-beta-carotenal 15,15'-oxygenase
VVAKRVCKLPAGLLHDVAFTKDYYLAIRFAGLALPKVLWGAEPVANAFRFEEKYPALHLVPRNGGAPKLVKLPNRVHFHFFNAFQDGEALVVDTIRYDGAVKFTSLYPPEQLERQGLEPRPTPRPQVVRYRISLQTLAVSENVLEGIACEAPAINPKHRGQAYRYGYAAATGDAPAAPDPWGVAWFDGVGKLDFESHEASIWQAGEGCICSPPAFVADPERTGEDAGFLLTWIQDPARGRSTVAVLDAQDLAAGPVASAHTSEVFGFLSHTDFLPRTANAEA